MKFSSKINECKICMVRTENTLFVLINKKLNFTLKNALAKL